MKAVYDFNGVTLYQGDSSAVLQALPDRSVHCAITSPPYFNLRSYLSADHADKGKEIGLEASPAAHLDALLRVFSECWRVLRDDGVLLINYGDSYAQGASGSGQSNSEATAENFLPGFRNGRSYVGQKNPGCTFLPAKNLLGMPWRLAFALQESGWILRSCLPWFKANPLPESVSDRATVAHEYVFLLTKRGRYWYDADAVRLGSTASNESLNRYRYGKSAGIKWVDAQDGAKVDFCSGKGKAWPSSRSFRTSDAYPLALADQLEAVDAEIERLSLLRCHLEKLGEARGLLTDTDGEPLALNLVSEPSREAHFAAFGTNLVKPLLLSCCPETVCAVCGAGYVRAVSISSSYDGQRAGQEVYTGQAYGDRPQSAPRGAKKNFGETHREDRGFSASCGCNAGTAPGVVLDPFMGTGTVAYVARALGRRAIGIELSSEYLEIARRRLGQGSLFLEEAEEETE